MVVVSSHRLVAAAAALAFLGTACTANVEVSVPEGAAPPIDAPATDAPVTDPPVTDEATEAPATEGPEEATDPPATDAPPAADGEVVIDGRFEYEDADCVFAEPSEMEVTCGWVTAPERWDGDTDDDTVRFHVARFHNPEADDGAANNPLVYLDGGPGGHALETVPFSFDSLFRPFTTAHDVVIWDQRGTGYSEPSLDCDAVNAAGDENLAVADPQVDELARETEALVGCIEDWLDDGVDLSAYNSVASSHDLEAVRLALGIDAWNVLGISYGTRLAQTYVREHPGAIRSVIIDSVVPVAGDLDADIPQNAERAFRQLFDGCAADPACNETYPDLENRLWAAADALDAEPAEFDALNAATGEGTNVLANGDDLISTVFSALYSTEAFAAIPQLVEQLEQGDTSGFATYIGIDLANQDFFSVGMLYAVRCHEEYPFLTDDAVANGLADDERINARFSAPGANAAEQFAPVCDAMQAGAADPVENEIVASDLPTLVLEGQYDPVTPPSGGEAVADGLAAATFVVMPHQGHGPISDACAADVAMAFLADPAADVDTSCVAGSEAPPWVPEAEAIELEPFDYDDGLVAASGLRPTGWTEAGSGVWSNQDNVLNQIVLLQQAAPGASPDLILDALISNTGAEDPDEGDAITDDAGRTWTTYRAVLGGGELALFLAQDDGSTLVVLLQGPAARLDAITADPIPAILSAMQG